MASKEKGNRIRNPKRKEMRVSCWVRGDKRKKARQKANGERAAENRLARKAGVPTPSDTAGVLREERRMPLRQAFALWPNNRSYAEWLASPERARALREGELIRERQKDRK